MVEEPGAVLRLGVTIEQPTQNTPPTECENAKLWAEVIDEDLGRHFSHKLRCKMWSCPFCSRLNARVLRSDISEAIQSYLEDNDLTEAQARYGMKFLTLTLPGKDYRGANTQAQGEEDAKKGLDKVLKMLRKHYGLQEYVWVREFQLGGWAHIHLLVMGGDCWKKDILPFVRSLWTDRYGLGNVDVRIVENSKHAAWYITKYVTKGLESGAKSKKCFSMSKKLATRASEMKKRKLKRFTVLRIGVVNPDGSLGRVLWEAGSTLPLDMGEDPVLTELLKFFESQGKGEQLKLTEDDLC